MGRRQSLGKLSDEALHKMTRGNCAECGYRGFVLGPRGGVAQNIECGNKECRARFNVLCVSGEMVMGSTIPRESEGGASWPSAFHTGTFS
jgi:hypothetical protein